MKFARGVIVLSCLLLIGCSKSSDETTMDNEQMEDEQQQGEDFTFSIFNNSLFGPGLTATVYLFNTDGQILAQGTFVPEEQTTLVSPGTAGMQHDFVLFYNNVDQNGIRYKTVFIFEDIAEGQYQYSGLEIPFYNYEPLRLSLYNIEERPLYVTSRDLPIISPYSGSNGGTIDLSFSFGITPELDGIYLAMRRNQDNFQRYYWSEDPPITDPIEMDYNELPLLDNIVGVVPLTEYDLGSFKIRGFTPADVNDFGHEIYRYTLFGFNTGESYGVPDGLFNRFSIEAQYNNSNSIYTVVKSANDPFTAIPTSALTLNVNNGTIQAFSADTSGDYDSFWSIYNYANTGNNIEYQVQLFGKKSAAITYNHSTLLNNVIGNELNVSNLEFQNIRLRNYGDISGYDDYFRKYLFNAPTPLPKGLDYESVFSY